MAENAGGSWRSRGLEPALEAVGDRWSLQLVDCLLAGPLRFTELQRELPGIAPNMLTERLRRLEAQGLLTAVAYSVRPPRAEYQLTRAGRRLSLAVAALALWGRAGESGPGPIHPSCGGELEPSWYCRGCASAVGIDETAEEEEVFYA